MWKKCAFNSSSHAHVWQYHHQCFRQLEGQTKSRVRERIRYLVDPIPRAVLLRKACVKLHIDRILKSVKSSLDGRIGAKSSPTFLH